MFLRRARWRCSRHFRMGARVLQKEQSSCVQVGVGGETFEITVRRVGITEVRMFKPVALAWRGIGWLWHQARHRGEWYVEVARRVPTKEMLTRVVPFSFRWRSQPMHGLPMATAEADRVRRVANRISGLPPAVSRRAVAR